MKNLVLMLLAGASLLGTAGIASAQIIMIVLATVTVSRSVLR